jgi:hypothetical protein
MALPPLLILLLPPPLLELASVVACHISCPPCGSAVLLDSESVSAGSAPRAYINMSKKPTPENQKPVSQEKAKEKQKFAPFG